MTTQQLERAPEQTLRRDIDEHAPENLEFGDRSVRESIGQVKK
jgi:hypothetical protein